MARRSAIAASFGNVLPNVTPGMAVLISPVAERISAGAVIFGSNVSYWLGPPCRKRNTTDLSVTGLPVSDSGTPARPAEGKSDASDSPPRPSPPTRRKSRRPYRVGPQSEIIGQLRADRSRINHRGTESTETKPGPSGNQGLNTILPS